MVHLWANNTSPSRRFCSPYGTAFSSILRVENWQGKSTISSNLSASLYDKWYWCTVTWWCIYRIITAALFPVISQGLTQCFIPLAAYDSSSITSMQLYIIEVNIPPCQWYSECTITESIVLTTKTKSAIWEGS